MSPAHFFGVLVLCLWMLDSDVNCENTQKGHVLRVQGKKQTRVGVHNDNVDSKRWIKQSNVFRIPTAGYKTQRVLQVSPRVYRAKIKASGSSPPGPGGFEQNKRKSHIQSHRSLKGQDVQSTLIFDSHKIPANPFRPRAHLLQPQELHLTTRPEISGYHDAHVFPKSFNPDRTNLLQKVLRPMDEPTGSSVDGPYPAWGPRVYSSVVMPKARGYAHTRRLRTGLHAPGSKEKQLNCIYSSRGTQSSSWPIRAQTRVQGKFKPFQTLPITNATEAVHSSSSDNETTPTRASAGKISPPSLNSTGFNSSVVPSFNGEFRNETKSTMGTESQDAGLESPAIDGEGQPGSSAEVGPSLEQNNPSTVSPSTLQPAENKKGDSVSIPPEKDQSEET